MPPLLRALCRRLTRWGILPAAREPNSAIINIYEAVSSSVLIKQHAFSKSGGTYTCTGGMLLTRRTAAGNSGAPFGSALLLRSLLQRLLPVPIHVTS